MNGAYQALSARTVVLKTKFFGLGLQTKKKEKRKIPVHTYRMRKTSSAHITLPQEIYVMYTPNRQTILAHHNAGKFHDQENDGKPKILLCEPTVKWHDCSL